MSYNMRSNVLPAALAVSIPLTLFVIVSSVFRAFSCRYVGVWSKSEQVLQAMTLASFLVYIGLYITVLQESDECCNQSGRVNEHGTVLDIMSTITITLVRLSALQLISGLFGLRRSRKLLLRTGIICIAWLVIWLLLRAFPCFPFSTRSLHGLWGTPEYYGCSGSQRFVTAYCVSDVILNCCVVGVSLYTVREPTVKYHDKILVVILYTLGVFVCTARVVTTLYSTGVVSIKKGGISKASTVFPYANKVPDSWVNRGGPWSITEMTAAILCVNLLPLYTLLRQEQSLLDALKRCLTLKKSQQKILNSSDTSYDHAHCSIQRPKYLAYLVLLYVAAALATWLLLVVMSFKPLTRESYSFRKSADQDEVIPDWSKPYDDNDSLYTMAKVIQSVVAVATIPLASTVCAQAAVIWMQRSRNISLRKTMSLSNKDWTTLSAYMRLFTKQGRRQLGQRYLYSAMALIVLGAIIAPLQQIFISSKSIQVPSLNLNCQNPTSVASPQGLVEQEFNLYNLTTGLQLAMSSTIPYGRELSLWGGDGSNSIFDADQTYLADIAVGYDTGIIRQYAPAIAHQFVPPADSTPADWPAVCSNNQVASFYTLLQVGRSSLEACLPAESIFTRDLQELLVSTESLYVRVTHSQYDSGFSNATFRMTATTTLGSFELPNNFNRGRIGPLIGNVTARCGIDAQCYDQSLPTCGPPRSNNTSTGEKYPGPMHVITESLFGNGSFLAYLAERQNTTDICERLCQNPTTLASWIPANPISDICSCGDNGRYTQKHISVSDYFFNWLITLAQGDFWESNLLPAIVLADIQWLLSSTPAGCGDGGVNVCSEPGQTIQIPAISQAGIIVISIVLALFLFALIAMTVYAHSLPIWTHQLDSFAMMRIGAARSELLPLGICYEPELHEVFDEEPGWIGDGAPASTTGRLAVGSGIPIGRRARFEQKYTPPKN